MIRNLNTFTANQKIRFKPARAFECTKKLGSIRYEQLRVPVSVNVIELDISKNAV